MSNNTKGSRFHQLPFVLPSTRGFEPPAPRLGGVCSVRLSYVDIYEMGFLPYSTYKISAKMRLYSVVLTSKFKKP